MRTGISLISMLFCTLLLAQQGVWATEKELPENAVSVSSVPCDYAMITNATAERFGAFGLDLVRWPSVEEIKRHTVDTSTNEAARNAVETTLVWAKKMLKKEWVPQSSVLTILAMTNCVNGHDAVRFRYQVAGSVIQVTSTTAGMAFLIKDNLYSANVGSFSQEQALRLMGSRIDRFFQHSDKIKTNTFTNVVHAKGGYEGRPVMGPDTIDYWWGLAGWWTDGNVFLVTAPTPKARSRGGAILPSLKKEWFRADAAADSENRK